MRRRALIVALALGSALLLGLLLSMQSLKPEPAAPELQAAPEKRITMASPEPGPSLHVSGRVRFPDGSPADEVQVHVWRPGDGRVGKTVTDSDGRYALEVQFGDSVNLGRRASNPTAHVVEAERQDLDFVTPERCPIQLRVQDPEGQALWPGEVNAQIQTQDFVHSSFIRKQALDESGWSELETACGQGRLDVRIPGWNHGSVQVDTEQELEVVLVLEQGVELSGTVSTQDGEPVTQGSVRVFRLGARAELDEHGRYALFLPAGQTHSVTARAEAPGLLEERHSLRLPAGESSAELNFVLQRFRQVSVRCVGLPQDSCVTVTPVLCTLPRLPAGTMCAGAPTVCECPTGQVAVRAGGRSVLLSADQDQALLDFQDASGSIVGRVLQDGQPMRCRWTVVKLPELGELAAELSGGGVAARQGRCEKDGSFAAQRLDPGRYLVELATGEARNPQPDVWVEGGEVDLGDIDIGGGGLISGVVLSGITGEPENNQPVLTVFEQRETVNPVGAGALSDTSGSFEITGIADGTYSVFLAQRPLERVTVVVSGGVADREVELETGEAKLLEEQGFTVKTGARGELLVDTVQSGGPAEAAGLLSGDVLVGIVVLGMDVLELAPSYASQATSWALDNYSGPGMTLVVERDGAELEVVLD